MQKSKQQKQIESLKVKVQQLETENKELRVIAERTKESEMNLANKVEKLNKTSKKLYENAEVFKNKYIALNNSIKYLCQANDNTIFGK